MADIDRPASRRSMILGSGTLGLASALAAVAGGAAGADGAAITSKPGTPMVDRGFVRIDEGPVHYRYVGNPGRGASLPILMAHAGPGSSEYFAGMMPGLAKDRFVFAPDMLGNGDSPPPARSETDIGYYVDATIRVMDALKIERVDFYGAHTGAQIGCEMAVRHPARIRRLALDGIPLFTPAFKQELLERYAPPIAPDAWGGHLAWAWTRMREGSQYWPHYAQDEAHRLASSTRTPEQMHHAVMDVLKVLSTYHIAFRASFRHDVHALLPQIAQPTLVMSIKRDPLHVYLDEAAAMIRNSQRIMIDTDAGAGGKLGALKQFFEA